jgi:hypothetical protein
MVLTRCMYPVVVFLKAGIEGRSIDHIADAACISSPSMHSSGLTPAFETRILGSKRPSAQSERPAQTERRIVKDRIRSATYVSERRDRWHSKNSCGDVGEKSGSMAHDVQATMSLAGSLNRVWHCGWTVDPWIMQKIGRATVGGFLGLYRQNKPLVRRAGSGLVARLDCVAVERKSLECPLSRSVSFASDAEFRLRCCDRAVNAIGVRGMLAGRVRVY